MSTQMNSRPARLRQGLPRIPGGEPWPPTDAVALRPTGEVLSAPAPEHSTSASTRVSRRGRWVLLAVLPAAAAAAALLVIGCRALLQFPPVSAFVVDYPGVSEASAASPSGFPAWLGWQHFLNAFLLVLIIKTGLQIRTQQRAPAHWIGRRPASRKISVTLWLHMSLDAVWMLNGLLYVILLFASGRWGRVIPTSWDVVPNALSAGLQYAAFDWPTENGWVSYNALQQLSYFAVVFLLAPLAAATGFRMSYFWPKSARLDRIFPVALARRLHFPVMLVFCLFILTHVGLVLTTGALRNLNHMYAGRDDDDAIGLIVFTASLLAMIAGWLLARPSVAAAFARLFGTVTR